MKSIRIFIFCCVTSIVMLAMGQVSAEAPATEKIVFASSLNVNVKGDSDIYIMNTDGTGRVNLTGHNAKDSEPTWSPSGRDILFTSDRDDVNDLYRMRADGKDVRRIFKKLANRSNPVWSPDGQQIAYYHEDEHAIYIADIDGNNEERLVKGWHPTWSPDSTEIAFMSLEEIFDIRVIDLKIRSERVLIRREQSILRNPVWSPDGTKIAFTRFSILPFVLKGFFGANNNAATHTIDIVNSDGTEVEIIVAGISEVSDPAWSPRSNRLVYSQLVGKERHLFKITLGSFVTEQLTDIGYSYGSDWFDPAVLPVAPQPQLRLTTWSKIKDQN